MEGKQKEARSRDNGQRARSWTDLQSNRPDQERNPNSDDLTILCNFLQAIQDGRLSHIRFYTRAALRGEVAA